MAKVCKSSLVKAVILLASTMASFLMESVKDSVFLSLLRERFMKESG